MEGDGLQLWRLESSWLLVEMDHLSGKSHTDTLFYIDVQASSDLLKSSLKNPYTPNKNP